MSQDKTMRQGESNGVGAEPPRLVACLLACCACVDEDTHTTHWIMLCVVVNIGLRAVPAGGAW